MSKSYDNGGKRAVPRHRKQVASSADRQERTIERRERRAGREAIAEQIPAAACPRCGGWTSYGGMSQHSKAKEPVHGRVGCTCT